MTAPTSFTPRDRRPARTSETRRLIRVAVTPSNNGDSECLPRVKVARRDWRHQAECSKDTYDAELWFPVGVSAPAIAQAEEAKKVCAGCPVRARCLEWATETGQDSGVWGGLSEQERRLLRRPSRLRAPKANTKLRHMQILRHELGRYMDLAAGGLTVAEIAAEMSATHTTILKVQQIVERTTRTVSA